MHWVNVHSRDRGLLALFLFSDVGNDDAPTEIIIGSHLDVPQILAPFGERGTWSAGVTGALPPSTFERPRAFLDRSKRRSLDSQSCLARPKVVVPLHQQPFCWSRTTR